MTWLTSPRRRKNAKPPMVIRCLANKGGPRFAGSPFCLQKISKMPLLYLLFISATLISVLISKQFRRLLTHDSC